MPTVPATSNPGRHAARAGFTLVEILLVVVILLISMGVAVPSLVRSYRGARLRTSARTIVMASKYARSVAVLRQTQAALLLDSAANNIEVVTVGSAAGADARSKFLDDRGSETLPGAAVPGADAPAAPAGGVESVLRRGLEPEVRVVEVEAGDGPAAELDGIYWMNYFPSGMCDEFSVTLQDDRNQRVTIHVDPMSGTSRVAYE